MLVLRRGVFRNGNDLERSWVAAGTIQADTGELFQIRQAGLNAVVVRQLDYKSLPPKERLSSQKRKCSQTKKMSRLQLHSIRSKSLLSVSKKARDAEGGTSQIKAVIDLAVSESNVAYSNSRINARLSLVHSGMVTDSECRGLPGMLSAIKSTSDSRMDSVHFDAKFSKSRCCGPYLR